MAAPSFWQQVQCRLRGLTTGVRLAAMTLGLAWMVAVAAWLWMGGLGHLPTAWAKSNVSAPRPAHALKPATASHNLKAVVPFTFVALGDMPYNGGDDQHRFEALIDQVNQLAPSFVVHVGDIKSGHSVCSDAAFEAVAQTFRRFSVPLVYTPGDNEWTDCHTQSAGRYDPVERLNKLRQLFWFDHNPYEKALPVVRQTGPTPQTSYPENVRWQQHGVTFVAINVPGSNNNRQAGLDGVLTPNQEYLQRNQADIAWLHQAFATAKQTQSQVVVIMMQADPGFEQAPPLRSGFNDLIDALTREVEAYSGSVLLVHGDSHRYRIDMPLRLPDPAKPDDPDGRLESRLQRLVVFGDADVHAVTVQVDPAASQPFTFSPLLHR
jgi:hypothetical protein